MIMMTCKKRDLTPGRGVHKITDTSSWFASLDRFANMSFMEDGRRQPPMPEARTVLGQLPVSASSAAPRDKPLRR